MSKQSRQRQAQKKRRTEEKRKITRREQTTRSAATGHNSVRTGYVPHPVTGLWQTYVWPASQEILYVSAHRNEADAEQAVYKIRQAGDSQYPGDPSDIFRQFFAELEKIRATGDEDPQDITAAMIPPELQG